MHILDEKINLKYAKINLAVVLSGETIVFPWIADRI